ncbi:MAG: alpha/beta hydrolase, partial [Lachnospiraceae bacterium]|nr:alpha/beta hydrolase [Lachnospiraceae bacterium]
MGQELRHNGEYVIVRNHRIHIFRAGNGNGPKLVFLSGSGTVAPVYDFKILYQKLLNDFEIIV